MCSAFVWKNTALHFAAREGHAKAVAMLLNYNAEILLNKQHASFLHIALHNKRKEVVLTTIRSKRCVSSCLPCNPRPKVAKVCAFLSPCKLCPHVTGCTPSLRTSEREGTCFSFESTMQMPIVQLLLTMGALLHPQSFFLQTKVTAPHYLLSPLWDSGVHKQGMIGNKVKQTLLCLPGLACQHKLPNWLLMKMGLGLGSSPSRHHACHPAQLPEFDLYNTYGRRNELTSTGCPLTK